MVVVDNGVVRLFVDWNVKIDARAECQYIP